MKAVILSAGQGRRLRPLTENTPKCLLDVGGQQVLIRQIDALLGVGVEEIVVLVGYGADQVEEAITPYGDRVRTVFNPFHSVADNLASCWMAREEMTGDFLLINGDTLFEEAIAERLIASEGEITVTIDRKPIYDADDMKVHEKEGRLLRIGKTLEAEISDAEAIGMIRFRQSGGEHFVSALNTWMRSGDGLKNWYLKVVDSIAPDFEINVCSIEKLRWAEIDTVADLKTATQVFAPTKSTTKAANA